MATTGHETERITVERLKQAMQGLNDKQGKVIPMNAIPTASTLYKIFVAIVFANI